MTRLANSASLEELSLLAKTPEQLAERAQSREWLLFWILVVPQIGVAGATLAVGLPGLVLPVACLPVLAAAVVNPFVGLAALFAILPFDDLLGVYETRFTLSKTIAVFTLVGFVIRAGRSGYSLLPVERVSRAAAAFAVLMALSSVWSQFPLPSLVGAISVVLLAGLTLIGVQLIDSRRRLEIVLTGLLISGSVVGLMLAFRVGGVTYAYGGEERMFLGRANPNQTGRVLVLASAAGLALLLYSRSNLLKLFTLAGAPFMFVGILLTKSRSSAMCYLCAGFLGILLGVKARIGTKLVVITVLVGLLAATFIAAGAGGLIDTQKIFSRWGSFSGAMATRTYIFETGLGIWTDSIKNMVLGIGYGVFDVAYTQEAGREQRFRSGLGRDPHNTWVKTLSETGVLGLALLVWVGISLVTATARAAPGYALVSWAGLAILMIGGLDATLTTHKYTWYSMILVGAIARVWPREAKIWGEDPLLAEYRRVMALH